MSGSRRRALASGDPNGIGADVALQALARLAPVRRARIPLFGLRAVAERAAVACGLEAWLPTLAPGEAGTLAPGDTRWGEVSAAARDSAIAAATAAPQACRGGAFDAAIACPHHETAIHRAGIPFSGTPPLVARVCGMHEGEVFLLLVGGGLRIVHATLRESMRTALDLLTPDLVCKAVRAGARACGLLGTPAPTIGVSGIDPHASEGGLSGPDDAEIVVPALERLRGEGCRVDGPQGADPLLSQRRRDPHVAMLHGQGHIPAKLLAPQAASALGIGGDALRSSMGHGSAMDIAGRGIADPTALRRTLALLSGTPA